MKRKNFYASDYMLTMFFALIITFGNLHGCDSKMPMNHEPNESRLRERVLAAHKAFSDLRFDDFVAIRSERWRRNLNASKSEKERVFQEWKTFVRQEKPTWEPIDFVIEGKRATVSMSASVLRHDGQRKSVTLYYLWLFENGDWFLDDADRTSPEYFPKE
jgi:hypothetical protein